MRYRVLRSGKGNKETKTPSINLRIPEKESMGKLIDPRWALHTSATKQRGYSMTTNTNIIFRSSNHPLCQGVESDNGSQHIENISVLYLEGQCCCNQTNEIKHQHNDKTQQQNATTHKHHKEDTQQAAAHKVSGCSQQHDNIDLPVRLFLSADTWNDVKPAKLNDGLLSAEC